MNCSICKGDRPTRKCPELYEDLQPGFYMKQNHSHNSENEDETLSYVYMEVPCIG